ncbi:MAG: glycosyltransferase [Chloroflexota bacterium]
MQHRNVLVIAYYFPPMGLSGVQRTLKFVKYLPGHGWSPIVLTTDSPAYYAFDDTLERDIDPEFTHIYRTPPDITKYVKPKEGSTLKYPSRFAQKLRRIALQTFLQPDSRRSWRKPALKLGEEIISKHNIDVIYATAPPFTDFWIGLELAEKFDIPLVVDYRDLWVDNAYYFYATPFHKLWASNLEAKILTHSKKAIVTARNLKEKLIKRYSFLSHQDVTIIPHGYDPEDFMPHRDVRPDPSKFVISHVGLFPDDLTPKYFLRALAQFLKNNPEAKRNLEARFVGVMRKGYLKMITKYGLSENARIVGYVPHEESVRHLCESDVLWMMMPNNIATPSRLYEYLGAGRTLLVSAPRGVIRQTAEDSGGAITTDPRDVAEIAEAIGKLYSLWKAKRLPVPNPKYVATFDRRKLTQDLARELAYATKIY